MSNILSMEWYRLRKSKYPYITLGIILILMFFMTYMISSIVSNNLFGVEISGGSNFGYSYKFDALAESLSGTLIVMALSIFSILYVGVYHKNKYDKNIIGLVGKRRNLIFSNLIICGLYNLIFIAAVLVTTYIGYMIFYSGFNNLPLGSTAEFLGYLGTYYLLVTSVTTIISCITYLVGSQTAPIIIYLIYNTGLPYTLIDFIIEQIGFKDISIRTYVPLGNLAQLTMDSINTYGRPVLVALIFGVIALLVNIWFYNKEDIVS